MTETRAQLYTSSWQAPYHSFRRQRQNSFILLPLLSPQSFATLRGPHEVIAFCQKPITWSLMISAKVPCFNHPEEAALPLRWLCQLPYADATHLLWTLRRNDRMTIEIVRNHSPTTSKYPPSDRAEKYRSFFVPSKGGSTKDASTTFGNPHRPAE